jgi:copper chaperone
MKKTLLVEGMSCGHCEKAVKGVLGELDGVKNVLVNLDTKEVQVEGDNLEDSILKAAIEDAGYDVIKFI